MPIPGLNPTLVLDVTETGNEAQVFQFPDHDFWNKHSINPQVDQKQLNPCSFTPSLIPIPVGQQRPSPPPSRKTSLAFANASTFRDRSGSIQSQSRRLSRKLPPALTESLENLACKEIPVVEVLPLARIASISEASTATSPTSSSFITPCSNKTTATMQPQLDKPLRTIVGSNDSTTRHSYENPRREQFILHADPPIHDDSYHIDAHLSELGISKSNSSKNRRAPSPQLLLPHALPSRNSSLSINSKPSLPSLGPRSISSSSLNNPITPTISRTISVKSEFLTSHAQRVQQVNSIMNGTAQQTTVASSSSTATSSGHARISSSDSDSMTPPTLCSGSSGSTNECGISWEVLDDIEQAERAARQQKPKESRQQRKERKKAEAETFNQDQHPSIQQLFEASELQVIDETGAHVKFGDLVSKRRTIVIFIRHWFCSLCAQYIKSIIAQVPPESLDAANVDMIIIGNGSDKMIDGYRNKHFHCPFPMYTDPERKLYKALGLTRKTADGGPDEDKGDYLVQSGLEQTVETIKRATKMPLRKPGHFLQLGGEFVFDGPLNVIFTNRMTTTRNHAPIRDVVAAAGVRLEFIHYEPGPAPPPVHREYDSPVIEDEEETAHDLDEWEAERQAQLERIQQLKAMRRKGAGRVAPKSFKRSNSVRTGKIQIIQADEPNTEAEVVMNAE